ncbi:hypothetical protein CLHOM_33240 [Clostridium homopropionicum DSM 5847]|uniref:Small, acid-soluble spore protein gamma-type n=1 Tax=Clostridium homopropionicum DSM 5847 TaxID=1121318 RepID=A0A0L6Z627_9CLOT|nr:hypothetical protein [Clostridium homopropionicum]KOA18422.1 hypothetical protein CLHOM_33240 [Clostridium homopropionicum DSM 5847]SFF67139.1 hypothetical protein SAMN04488501_101156 [Clostridium homopropionicum]
MSDKNSLQETKKLNEKSARNAGTNMTSSTAGMGSFTSSTTPISSDSNSLQETRKKNNKSAANKGQF